MDASMRRDIDRTANAFFGGDSAARGMVLDLEAFPDYDGYDKRYLAVIRKPTGWMDLGTFDTEWAAKDTIEKFWEGMRALLAPA